jgi:uncharacterized membrane protein YeaQ/YmgE (transglycosylase-associated protein family)
VISDRTANILIGVVTAMWAGNIIAGMVQVNDYQPSESINGIFMAIVGGAFALRAKTKSDDERPGKPDKPRKVTKK